MELTQPKIIILGNVINDFTLSDNGLNQKQYFNFKPDVEFNYFAFVQQTNLNDNGVTYDLIDNVVLNICNYNAELISKMPVKNLSQFISDPTGLNTRSIFGDYNYYNFFSLRDIDINNCYLTNTTLNAGTGSQSKSLRIDVVLFNISWQ
jgi:hypothetical protein